MGWARAWGDAWGRDVLRSPARLLLRSAIWIWPALPPILLAVIGALTIDGVLGLLGDGLRAGEPYLRWGLDGSDVPAVSVFQMQMALAVWILSPSVAIAGFAMGLRAIAVAAPGRVAGLLAAAAILIPIASLLADQATSTPLYERIGTRFFGFTLAPRLGSADWATMLDWAVASGNLSHALAASALVLGLVATMRRYQGAMDGADTAEAKLEIMQDCGFTVTRNPSEMAKLLKARL